MSNLIRGISENGGVVFCGVDSTEIVRTAEQLHHTSATCSAALGRLLTGASLMGSMLKDDGDSITLRVAGGGPTGTVVACTDGTGNVKGCIDHPLVELPLKANGHLDVGGAVGKNGVLTVIRDNRLQKEPTVGQVPLVSGEIAEDMMNLALAGFNPNVLDEREVQYKCDCSEERTEEMLLSLGRKELEKLRDEDPDCEVVCHFCHTKYHFDLNKLVEKAAYKKEKAETQEPEA